jgi:hypothetical protein
MRIFADADADICTTSSKYYYCKGISLAGTVKVCNISLKENTLRPVLTWVLGWRLLFSLAPLTSFWFLLFLKWAYRTSSVWKLASYFPYAKLTALHPHIQYGVDVQCQTTVCMQILLRNTFIYHYLATFCQCILIHHWLSRNVCRIILKFVLHIFVVFIYIISKVFWAWQCPL